MRNIVRWCSIHHKISELNETELCGEMHYKKIMFERKKTFLFEFSFYYFFRNMNSMNRLDDWKCCHQRCYSLSNASTVVFIIELNFHKERPSIFKFSFTHSFDKFEREIDNFFHFQNLLFVLLERAIPMNDMDVFEKSIMLLKA
jgi:hypothetical protein